jgi:hypothetical protein
MHVRLWGGLGNQLLQWAFGRSLSLSRDESVTYDHLLIDEDPKRSYSLGAYDISVPLAAPSGPIFKESTTLFDPAASAAPRGTLYSGNWFTEKYFNADVIRRELAAPRGIPNDATLILADQINDAKNSAFIGVRRGDFVYAEQQRNFHGSMPLSYFSDGIRLIQEYSPDVKFFVFSDDLAWCRENFVDGSVVIVDANRPGDGNAPGTEHWDIWLMKLCRHALIANSSFHWWGAWLNPKQDDRVVVAPKQWYRAPIDTSDMVPERWTCI